LLSASPLPEPKVIHYNKDNESLERKPALFVGADFSDPKSITDPNFD